MGTYRTYPKVCGMTPSQYKFSEAHKARLERINSAAARLKAPPVLTRPYRPSWTVPAPETPREWAQRQKLIPIPVTVQNDRDEPRNEAEICVVRIETIQIAVTRLYGVSRIDLLSSRRSADVVRPRQVAMYLAKTLTLRSLPEIGRLFGGRDHTTVLHAVRKIKALVTMDTAVAGEVERVKEMIMELRNAETSDSSSRIPDAPPAATSPDRASESARGTGKAAFDPASGTSIAARGKDASSVEG